MAPAPMFEFIRIADEAGFPPGVVNVKTGYGEPCGRMLTSHPDVARVAFTGGPETARHLVRNTAENFYRGITGTGRQVAGPGIR